MKEKHHGKKARQTRNYIIRKAAPIFNKKGYAGTSMSDLIHATGLTKGSIYGNFAGKDELAVSVFHYNVKQLFDVIDSESAQGNSYIEKLLIYPEIFRNIYKELLEQGGSPILNTAVEADDTHPAILKLAANTILYFRNTIRQIIEDGIAFGEISSENDALMVAELIIVLFEGGSALSKATGEESFIENAISQIEQIINSIKIKD